MRHPETNEMSIIIIDEFTGRLMLGRQWSDGLHQAVEAKHAREGVKIKEETQTLATITLQNFFKLYKKLAGMTGTAMTEANEFWKIYKLDVIAIPTNKPLIRINYPDVIFRTEKEKWKAVVDEDRRGPQGGPADADRHHRRGQVDKLSDMLKRRGIKHELLNAMPEHAAREAEIVAQAGRIGAVTIATNMAGRGTDIILGGNPETLAWARLKDKYATRLDVPEDDWKKTGRRHRGQGEDEGRRPQGGRDGRPAHRRHRTARGPPHRQPAARPGRPAGRSRLEPVLPVARRRPDAHLRRRMGRQRPDPARHGGRPGHREPHGRRAASRPPRRRSRNATSTSARTCSNTTRSWTISASASTAIRQEILDGANCKLRILDMLDEQIDLALERFLDPRLRRRPASPSSRPSGWASSSTPPISPAAISPRPTSTARDKANRA